MVYVAITVATLSIVVMCCAWVLTRNPILTRRRVRTYNTVEEEEEKVELCAAAADADGERNTSPFVLGDEEEDDTGEGQMDAV